MKLFISDDNNKENTDIYIHSLEENQIYKITPQISDTSKIFIEIELECGRYSLWSKKNNKIQKYNYEIIEGNTTLKGKKNAIIFEIKELMNNKVIYDYPEERFIKDKIKYQTMLNSLSEKHLHYYWVNIHLLCLNYPDNPSEEDKNQIKTLISLMKTEQGLLCPICRSHFNVWVDKNNYQDAIENKEKLFEYFWRLHNEINANNSKDVINLENAKDIYKLQDWDIHLEKYDCNILPYFKNKNIKQFVINFNSISREIMKKEILEKINNENEISLEITN